MVKFFKKNKRNIISYLIIFIFSLILFNAWLQGHYATDTYGMIEKGYENYAIMNSLRDGRIPMAIIMFVADYFKIDIIKLVQITLIFSIGICCVAILYIKNIIMEKIEKESIIYNIIVCVASYFTIFNFMFLENIYYVESIAMSFCVLLCIISANTLIKEEKWCFIKSLIMIIIAVTFYQGTANFFITMVVFLACISFKNNDKKIVKSLILGGIIWGISILLNYFIILIVQFVLSIAYNRRLGLENLVYNFSRIINHIPKMLVNTNFYFPKYLFITYLLSLILGGTVYYFVRDKENKYRIGHIILISLIAYFSCFVMSLVTLSSFGSSRMMFSIGAITGLLIMYYLTNIKNESNFKILCIGILMIYSFITITVYYNKIEAQIEINKSDIEWTKRVDKLISEYENNSGANIKYIAFSKDLNCYMYYNNINTTALEDTSIEPTWSRVGLINHWTGRDLKEVEMNEEVYNRYFKDKNWDEFNEEQCVFIDETFYYCIY